MQVQNINGTTFQGGFRFRGMSEEARLSMTEALPKRGKQIFENFENNGDVFLVVRDELDIKVAKFVNKLIQAGKNLIYEYYPEINTKCGLDCEEHEKLSNLLKNYTPEANGIEKIVIKAEQREKLNYIRQNSNKYTQNILNKLQVYSDNLVTKTKFGAKIIEDKTNDRTIIISPPDKDGFFYVRDIKRKSTSSNEFGGRYKMTFDGEYADKDTYNKFSNHALFTELFNKTLIK